MSVSIVTTCKGRLSHLKETIWHMLGQAGAEVVVVDYGCPDHAADWCESQGIAKLRTVRAVNDVTQFNGSRARNIGIRHASGDYLAMIDADVGVPLGFADRFIREMEWNGWDLGLVGTDGKINGQCVVTRKAWEAVRGYDEGMTGWGFDDIDFYDRITRAGLRQGILENCKLSLIVHDEAESTRFHAEKSKERSSKANGERMQNHGREINPGGFGLL